MTHRESESDFAERLLFDLVSTPSVSGAEQNAVRVFAEHARSLGYLCEIDEAGSAHAHRGEPGASVHIVLLGHIDTVPGQIPVRVDEDRVLHGRGSVDAKGPLAAMLVGAARAELPRDVRVTVIAAVGEETTESPGARHVVGMYRPNACIIGEPSGWDGVTLGYKGRLVVEARCALTNAHSAGPDLSACDEVLTWWSRVVDSAATFNRDRERVFDQIQCTVRGIESSDDGLDQVASLSAGFRLPLGVDPHELERELSLLNRGGLDLHWAGHERAVVSDRNDAVVRALMSGIRGGGGKPRPKRKTGTADFNVVAPHWRCPIAAYGPGDSALDHTPVERLSIDEYLRSIDVLRSAVEQLASEQAGSDMPQDGGTHQSVVC